MTERTLSWAGARILVVSPTPTHPQDHGNRKRIFAICSQLKSEGAFIHFAHYAAEHDWRHDRPVQHERAMRAAWDAYDLIPPSREVHQGSAGRDHAIDEWADPSLAAYVRFVCHVHRFDAVIVNYTWLSFCLDAAPASVFKILDAHDAFGNRRAMLAKLGVDPEFFHTTEEEEAKALARADLVWAIKDAERDYFTRDLRVPRAITMLHAEAPTGAWQGARADDARRGGPLRAGVMGARNNVNRRNFEEFLAVALPIFRSHLADVRIVIGGGMADDFADLADPHLEILGRVAHVDEFYRSVDLVIAPIATSTGLKIKVSEALAAGAPLLALAHAGGDYPTSEPAHLLPDFAALAKALAELAFDRAPLPRLALVSAAVSRAIAAKVLGALRRTRDMMIERERDHVLIVAPLAALNPASILHDHLQALENFLRAGSKIALYLTGSDAAPGASTERSPLLRGLRVFADPALVENEAVAAPQDWSAVTLGDLLSARGFTRAYLMADCRALADAVGRLERVYLRHDAITIAGGDADALVEHLRPVVPLVLLGAHLPSIGGFDGRTGVVDVVRIAFRKLDPFACFTGTGQGAAVLILASRGDRLGDVLAAHASTLGATAALLDPSDPAFAAALVHPTPAHHERALFAGARLVVSLASHPTAAILAEAARRRGIPLVTPSRGPDAAGASEFEPASLLRLLRVVGLLLADGAFAARAQEQTTRAITAESADAGWYWLWRDLHGAVNEGWERLFESA